MANITAEEKEVLGEWIFGVDILKIRIITGKFADIFCGMLGAQAITLGNRIFASKDSYILMHPCMHPVRLGTLAHELLHVKQEKRAGIFPYLIFYVSVAGVLALVGLGILFCKSMRKAPRFFVKYLANFIARHHPCEKPAYIMEAQFLETYWTDEEANK
ncbi:MAG: DUF4157 domain-containing protein [Candidatus Spechtbacteria bacterium]|nr:DUF4157 domain-containing protein [Candidatus Spechtbacteria bacterium]